MYRLVLSLVLMLSGMNSPVLAVEEFHNQSSLTDVIELMAGQPTQAGTFSQDKSITGLNQSLRSSGQYYIEANVGIVWKQLIPFEDLLVVKEQQLFSLMGKELVPQDVPANVVNLMTDIFSGLMTGDITNLERQFDIQLKHYEMSPKAKSEWIISLNPNSAPLNVIFNQITLSGNGHNLTKVHLSEISGDSTSIVLDPYGKEVESMIKHWLRGQD
ncbi:hypothetical protein BCU68_03590 [Vibrio sp. 10N.286.49.B3]|uniref:LolA family protein n=1 Tax=Vibrio sp. 10N.286.49.B3 TaxID=1880855 RepID=UPI000C85C316|nr:outer membrane lipoprotein carrier protein LolA [Vibrio sp. 10N.286.49.B3]PMH44593.1 hypothetical protein BCU68_03590 [Vibrio sp. 10N.286.49.B3]